MPLDDRCRNLFDSKLLLYLVQMRRFRQQMASTNLRFIKIGKLHNRSFNSTTPLNNDRCTKLLAVLFARQIQQRSRDLCVVRYKFSIISTNVRLGLWSGKIFDSMYLAFCWLNFPSSNNPNRLLRPFQNCNSRVLL